MPESRKHARKAPKDPYRFRSCRLCKAKFKPTTHVISCADSQEFCCPNHRKEYWKYGGLPFDKLMARIEKRCREIAREEIVIRLDAALDRLRQSPLVYENLQKMIAQEFERTIRIHERLTGKGPIGKEAAQALVDSLSPVRTEPHRTGSAESPQSV